MKRIRTGNVKVACAIILHFTLYTLHSLSASAESVNVVDCARDPALDVWAASDAKFAGIVMEDVFKAAGVEPRRVGYRADGMSDTSNAVVVCSAFRTDRLRQDYGFPLQPLGRMHFALYAMPDRAPKMLSTKITDWPRMRVAYSPVSQGQGRDRERYFEHATLNPEYVEYRTSAGAVQALRDGKVDLIFLYTPEKKRPEGLVEVVPIGSRNVYFAVRKDHPELLARLSAAYRECYITNIAKYDKLREELLGVPTPSNRVRVAAYCRGSLFDVSKDGEQRTGVIEEWLKAIAPHTHWSFDYVYGEYDESLNDVTAGRLDLVGGIGFTAGRGDKFFFPHTPIGMLRVFLWTHQGNRFKAGDPSSWNGMKVGVLAGALSAQRIKRQLENDALGISCHEYTTDQALLNAYFSGEVDALVDIEMPELDKERALHIYASHPMYLCASPKSQRLFNELERALDEVCDDFPRYMKMITSRHYGLRTEMSLLTLKEANWLRERLKDPRPVMIDFSPWPVSLKDSKGRHTHFAKAFLAELEAKTGLKFDTHPQTGIQTAEAKFLRGDTDFWIPYPAKIDPAAFGAVSVFSIPVPENYAKMIGAEERSEEFELWASHSVPEEEVAVLRKAINTIDPLRLQEMFMTAAAERTMIHRVFGLTRDELSRLIVSAVIGVLLLAALYGTVMIVLLKRQARRANEAAAAAESHAQAKTRFLAMMSHELRTPLNAVIGFAEFLAREKLGEERSREYTDGILLSATALLELINDILDLSKLEAGAMNMRSGACDINQLLRELPAIFGYRVRRHGVKLGIETSGDLPIPVVELSQQGMRQILINLVGNAAKFTEQGEIVVRVTWASDTRTLSLDVTDTGIGISEEKMSKLFDPFVQDIASRMRRSGGEMKGTGLGLPIVKRMVENANGTIKATSELGKGTTFLIEISDLTVVDHMSAAPRAAEETIRAAMPERVLVVDDMTMNRKILGIHLGNLKVKDIRFAENGEDALKVMNEWVPDLVLSDMWMPKMDGTQLAEAMRRDRRLAEVPIVAVTADVDVGSSYDMSLFAKIIAKPVTTDKLRALFGDIADG